MAKAAHPGRILAMIIDDDAEHIGLLMHSIERGVVGLGCDDTIEAAGYPSVSEALEAVHAGDHVVFLCDYQMPGGTALEWLPYLLNAGAGPIVVMTSAGSEEVAAQAYDMGASKYVDKARAIREPEFIVGLIRDASRQYVVESRNRDLLKELRQANRALEQKANKLNELTNTAHAFVADVAHDFRTPLATIKEFAGIVADGIPGPVNDKQVEYLRYVESSVLDLAHMVDDFLDSAKMRAGLLRMNRKPHTIDELFDTVRRPVQRRADARGITVSESIDAGLPLCHADLVKAGRVLTNLLINAIKFSHENSMIRVHATQNDSGGVEIAVADSGRGIAPEDLETIFSRFSQVDTVQTERIKGFGLGLSICSQLATLNLGQLHVESEYGKGSTFSVTLPPAHPASLIRHYAEFLVRMNIGRRLIGLRITPRNPRDSIESLRSFLTSTSYPLDLVLEPNADEICVLGVSSDPDLWVARLISAGLEAHPPVEFDIERAGLWRLPEQVEQIVETLAIDLGAPVES